MPEEMLPAAQRESRKKSHQPSEPGRGGDPRAAGAPQQARISPAKREDARRLAPAASGGQGTRHATVTPSAARDKGVYGGCRGCRGARPSHPLPPAGRRPSPDAGLKPQASGNKNRLYAIETEEMTFRRSEGNLHAGGDAPRRATRKPKKIPPAQRAGARRRSPRNGSAAAGAHIVREAGRCAPIAPCGERRTGYMTCDSDVLRHTDKGEYGGRRGCRGACPSTPPAAS